MLPTAIPRSRPVAEEHATTHEPFNQASDLVDYDPLAADAALSEALDREGAGWAREDVQRLAQAVGSAEVQDWARLANRHLPELKTHDRTGRRIDHVEFHPAYHALMSLAFGSGVHAYAWNAGGRTGAHVARAALSFLWNQADNGVACPTGMAYSSIPVLESLPQVGALWVSRINAQGYEPQLAPVSEKRSATIGMTLTEKQGGSDLRANTMRAEPLGTRGLGGEYRLTGHKWFCSAPMSDGFYVLAYAPDGPTCFLVPRVLPDGRRNVFRIQRLKEKCGNRSNASSEVEFEDTFAWALCNEGRGIRTALEMAHLTRLDFAIGSAGLMRHALAQAIHHSRHRRAFQKPLFDQPLMAAVLADLALESEASTLLAFRMARACDAALAGDPAAHAFERLATPVAKYWICKRATGVVHEALECHGGNGFVEEHVMPRLYREAPLNGIWEGSGNLIALDVLRALRTEPQALDAVRDELEAARGGHPLYDGYVEATTAQALAASRGDEAAARRVAERLAVSLQASLMIRFSIPEAADAFCAARLGPERYGAYGALPAGVSTGPILARAWPL